VTGLQSRVLHGCRNKVTNSPCSPAAFRSDRGTHSAVSGCHELGRWRNPEAGNRSVPSQQGAEGRGFSPAMGNGQNRRGFGRWGSRELLLRKMNERTGNVYENKGWRHLECGSAACGAAAFVLAARRFGSFVGLPCQEGGSFAAALQDSRKQTNEPRMSMKTKG